MHRTIWAGVAAGLLGMTMSASSVEPTPVAAAAAAPRCSSGVPGDVNGDGYAEMAVGEPGNSRQRGSVHLFYGSRRGLQVDASGSALDDQYLTQDTPGVPGRAERDDQFGWATLLADLNGDGCADLVVSSPGEDDDAGRVQVFPGSPRGLRTSGVQTFTVGDLPGAAGSAAGQHLGLSLAAGDVDGDGIEDLLAAAPWRDVAGQPRAGAVALLYGSEAGLDLGRSVLLTRDTPGIPGEAAAYTYFGSALATGDFDGNGTTEMAFASWRDDVQVLARTGSGFTGLAPIRPEAPGIPGDGTRFCDFGQSLASGDANGDRRDDLVVGVPNYGCTTHEDEPGHSGIGGVVLLLGSATGLTTAGSQLWTQKTPGVQGKARFDNGFGSSVALAPLDRNGTADLVIGASSDGGGSATVLLGSASGLTTNGIGGVRYTQATPGIPGARDLGASFGQGIRLAFVQSRAQATLVISAPRQTLGRDRNAGSVTQIPIGRSGPDPSQARRITAHTAGVKGEAATNDYFGGWS